MVFKATINQSQVHVTLVHANDPKNHCVESLYPFFFQFVTPFHLFFTLTTLVVVFKRKTVQYKNKIYANFDREIRTLFF